MYLQSNLFDGVKERSVRRIDYEEANARRMPCVQYAFGLFEDSILVGVVTYGQPATPSISVGIAGKENKWSVVELNRLVILPEYNGSNSASYLVSRSLKMLPPRTYVVSYADWGGWGHVGYIYQATNFLYTGMTRERTDISPESGHPRHYNKGETKRIKRTAKHRYIYMCGNKKERKEMRKELKWKVIDHYPKGESRKYDIRNPVGR